ncbi:jg9314, partial [Pararge aegeria aegeria]
MSSFGHANIMYTVSKLSRIFEINANERRYKEIPYPLKRHAFCTYLLVFIYLFILFICTPLKQRNKTKKEQT